MKNIMLTTAYDGTDYGGWQRQKNAVTVQEKIEDALNTVLKTKNAPLRITGASRTDAGVHAADQKACFFIEDKDLIIPADRLPLALNPKLPRDISVYNAEEMPLSFHPRFHAVKKEYRYRILNAKFPDPISRNYAWHVHYPLDIHKIREAAAFFIGTHDFSAFCAAGAEVLDYTRTVYTLDVIANNFRDSEDERMITISITGSGFLYNMVRIIAGTLMYAGAGKIPPGDIPGIIAGKNREQAGITAPPQGLILWRVWYCI